MTSAIPTLAPRVYGYCRVSTTMQVDEGVSLDEQQRRIEGRALEQGWKIAKIFVEAGVSGSIPFGERPQGARLNKLLRPGDIVIASKLDRMFRSAYDMLGLIRSFQERKISLWLLDLGGDVSGNGIAKLMLTMVSAFAEFERDRIGERIRDAKTHRRSQGRFLGGKRPFGYQVGLQGTLIADPVEQAAIAEMHRLHAAGLSRMEITRTMQASGFKISRETVRLLVNEAIIEESQR